MTMVGLKVTLVYPKMTEAGQRMTLIGPRMGSYVGSNGIGRYKKTNT